MTYEIILQTPETFTAKYKLDIDISLGLCHPYFNEANHLLSLLPKWAPKDVSNDTLYSKPECKVSFFNLLLAQFNQFWFRWV